MAIHCLPLHAQTETDLSLSSRYAIIWNRDAQVTVYEKNAHETMYPASMTKIMTAIVALEHIPNLQKEIVLYPQVFSGLAEAGASVVGYEVGDTARLIDLFYGLMLPSGADAARALAIEVAGSEADFVALMNQTAAEWKLENTHFVNVSGLHDDNHYTTAADMEIILQKALENETFKQIFTSDQYTNADHSLHLVATYASTGAALGIDTSFLLGAKIGYTPESGRCLASLIKTDDTSYIVITGGADGAGHLLDAQRIHAYLQEHYTYQTIYPKGEAIDDIAVRYGDEDHVAVAPQADIKALVAKGSNVEAQMEAEESLLAPVEQGANIAKLKVSYAPLDWSETVPLYAMAEIKRQWLPYLFHQWWFIIPLVALIGGITIALLMKGREIQMDAQDQRNMRMKERRRKP